MIKIQTAICSTLIILGIADLLTTVIGISGKSATEVNPLFAALTQTNMLAFIGLKILTILFIGFMFMGATRIANESNSGFKSKLLVSSASIASNLIMTVVVANNVLVILKM